MKKQNDPKYQTQEYLEQKRAWDRDYYQRHKEKRQAANHVRKHKMYEYLQQIKMKSACKYCGESHPAALQFHHRDPEEKEFAVSTFIYHQKGGPARLEAEIAKCDVLCANCHLKYHYDNDPRRLRIPDLLTLKEDKKSNQTAALEQNEEFVSLCERYFLEGIDPLYLTDDFYMALEKQRG